MKNIISLTGVLCLFVFLAGCGTEELTPMEAEKAIRSSEPWTKEFEFKIVEGDFIPKTVSFKKNALLKETYLPFYKYLQKSGYLKFDRIYGYKKHGPRGERYMTDIYEITATEKLKLLIHETVEASSEYGVYPPGRDVWKNEQASYLVHKVKMKLIDYRFVKINRMDDLQVDSSSSSGCDINVNFSYEKNFTTLGKLMGEYPGGRAYGENPNTDSIIEDNICFQLSDDKWKIVKQFTPK